MSTIETIYRRTLRPVAKRAGVNEYAHDAQWRLERAKRGHSPSQSFVGIPYPTDEAPVLWRFADEIEAGSTVWDVGGNMGSYSALAAALGAEVVAWEPHPANAERLRENLARNGYAVSVRERALADEAGTARLSLDDGTAGHSLARDGAEHVQVEIERGDDVPVPAPDVLKVDVEGAEVAVLDGLAETLAAVAPTVLLEAHGDREREACAERLGELGYTVEVVHRRRSQSFLLAVA